MLDSDLCYGMYSNANESKAVQITVLVWVKRTQPGNHMMAKCIAQPRSLHPTPIRINVHNLEKYEVTLLVRDITGQTKCHDAEPEKF